MVPMHAKKREGAFHEPRCRNADFPVGASGRLENRRYEAERGSWSQCMRKSERGLSMNHAAVTPTFQSARLAGWKTGATKLNAVHGPNACEKARGGFP